MRFSLLTFVSSLVAVSAYADSVPSTVGPVTILELERSFTISATRLIDGESPEVVQETVSFSDIVLDFDEDGPGVQFADGRSLGDASSSVSGRIFSQEGRLVSVDALVSFFGGEQLPSSAFFGLPSFDSATGLLPINDDIGAADLQGAVFDIDLSSGGAVGEFRGDSDTFIDLIETSVQLTVRADVDVFLQASRDASSRAGSSFGSTLTPRRISSSTDDATGNSLSQFEPAGFQILEAGETQTVSFTTSARGSGLALEGAVGFASTNHRFAFFAVPSTTFALPTPSAAALGVFGMVFLGRRSGRRI